MKRVYFEAGEGRHFVGAVNYLTTIDGAIYADSPISIDSDTEFVNAIRKKEPGDVWPVMDELMSVLRTMVPRLYDSVMRRLM